MTVGQCRAVEKLLAAHREWSRWTPVRNSDLYNTEGIVTGVQPVLIFSNHAQVVVTIDFDKMEIVD